MSRGGDRCLCMFLILLTASSERAGARQRRRVSLRLAVGGLPPALPPSGAGLARGTRGCCRLCTPARGPPHRGGGSPMPRRSRVTTAGAWSRSRSRQSAGPPGPWPTETHAVPARWRPPWWACFPRALRWRERLPHRPAPATCALGAAWAPAPSVMADAGAWWRGSARPRRLRPGPGGPGGGPAWCGRPVGAALASSLPRV